jgi:cytochrome c oxidase assembly protein subunit 15
MPSSPNQSVHRFAVFIAYCTVLLLTAGALVTSNDAGLAVPDWPLSYGSLMPPMIGGIFYEHGHRMIASLVGALTIVLAIWLSRVEPRRWVRLLGWGALGLIVAQGLLGGLTVLLYLPPAVSSAHATLAQLFFITIITLAVATSRWWQSDLEVREDRGSPSLRTITVLTTASIVVQLFLGAAFRHGAFGIVPHLIGAGVVTAMVIWTTRVLKRRFHDSRTLRRALVLLHATFGTQILLGGITYWVVLAARRDPRPLPLFISVTVAHVVLGALTLAASMVLTLACFRLLRPSRAVKLSHSAQRATI